MSISCTTRATATLYGTGYSVVTQVAYSNQYDNGSYVQTSYLETSTIEQAVPTETQYGTACQTIDPSSRASTRTRAQEKTSTQILPTSTATYVMASTAAADQGGEVVLVTSIVTMSATSVFVVYQTETPAIAAPTVTSSHKSSSSSSHAGPIAGGIVAAVVLIALLAILAWFLRKRSRRDRDTRALDDFFKDALNPGEGGMVEDDDILGAAVSNRRSMKRKSSLVLDLEKEKNLSHSNDEDNWAALTRMSSIADDDRSETYRQRSLSRQSLNAISRGASIRSHGQDDVIMAAVAGVGPATTWDGVSARPLTEEPETIHFPLAAARSHSSVYQQDESQYHPRSTRRMSSRLSSRSADLLPLMSPGLASPRSPSLINDTPSTFGVRNDEFFAPPAPPPPPSASPPLYGPNRSRSQHMSMSGLNGLPYNLGPGSPTTPPQNVPERPKSALGIMAVPEENHGDHDHQQQAALPLQQPFHWSPPARSTPLRSRASIAGYGQYGAYSQWSPPLRPHRVGSNRPLIGSSQFSSEYPPSRYSHLDVINQQAEGAASTITTTRVEEAETAREVPIHREMRHRSLSGSILMKAAASIKERKSVDGSAAAATGDRSDSSDLSTSASASQKNSLNTRNPSSEQQFSEDDEETNLRQQSTSALPAYHEKMASSVLDRTLALINGGNNSANPSTPEDTPKRTSFWQPQAWRAKVAT